MKRRHLQLLSLLLAFAIVVGLLPIQAFAEELETLAGTGSTEPVVVIAGSDFQDPDGHEDSSANTSAILTAIKQRYSAAYGFLFAGDYDYNYNSSDVGLATLRETVKDAGLGIENTVWVQGNHDDDSMVSEGLLSASGANDTEHYGVYVINEQDYMHNNTDASTIAATAEALDAYLSAKAEENYKKPIFVVSHLPLHYSMRTYRDGDAMHADKIFDVLNKSDSRDLNVIYLYGHNHSHGWDDYLGGSSVFLRPGNVLLVANGSKTEYERHTLGFTYMNAGFVGYYSNQDSGADTALSMTTFAIYKDRVVINRFDSNGLHKLKSPGKYGADYGLDKVEQTMYDVLGRVYEHSETIYLTSEDGGVIAPEYSPSGSDHGWIQISADSKTVWRATSTLTSGKRYLIVDNYIAGNHRALAKNTISSGLTYGDVTVIQDSNNNYIEEAFDQIIWTYSNNKFTNRSYRNTTYYLRGSDSELRTSTSSSSTYTSWRINSNYGLYTTSRSNGSGTKYYLGDDFTLSRTASRTNRVYLFVEDTMSTPSLYASFFGSAGVTLPVGIYGTVEEIEQIIHESFTVFTATDSNGSNKTVVNDYQIVGEFDPAAAGTYTLSIQYKGVEITKYILVLEEREIMSISCDPMTGYASFGSTTTGSILTVSYSDGSTSRQYVTVDMLSGNFNLKEAGTYENLTIKYGDHSIPGYTLNVYVNDYPEFPHEGSVRVNKGATGIDFDHTGIAKVDLAATGVPIKRGADVIIMLDTSSSMNNTVDGSSRINVLNASLADLVNDLQRDGEDGTPMDIRLSIADFNNYYGSTSSPYYQSSADHLTGTTARGGTSNPGVDIYTGDGTLTAGSLVSVHDLTVRNGKIYDANDDHIIMTTSSGTNYDYAFDAVYQIASSVKAENEANGEERDLFVIFMSDGAPFQYNYFSSQSEAANWNNWLQGTATDSMFASGSNKNYYNEEGKHWMAEAIKGDPDQRYTVIRKNDRGLEDVIEPTGTDNMYTLPGLGAKVFSIGFCLAADKQITVDSMTTVLKNISSNADLLYYEANNAEDLHNAFHMIGQEINYAATDAYFIDHMGLDFDLQMASKTYTVNGETRTLSPTISFTLYGVYTLADVEAGIITYDQIGTRNGRSTVVETVTFNADGTEAYSNGGTRNIMHNGIIYARNFWYNTNDYSVMIDSNLDGTEDYLLANETFYWDMGTINQHDMVLSYYTYLNGSMEGTLPSGVYNTNESATLYYKNWLGNDAKRETVSPQMPWKEASVRYAFYLVDENGHPLVNQDLGLTGSFANRINLIQPTHYENILLNSTSTLIASELVSNSLPEGYELYDSEASYTIHVGSAEGGSSWVINKGNVETSSTYVTGHNSYQFSNELQEDTDTYDYTHTIVWFAVVYKVKPVNDVVVIDYGLPVFVQVLLNDMFYNKGGVVAIGPAKNNSSLSGDAQLDSEFIVDNTLRTVYEGKYGTATLTSNGVRYALKPGAGMNMTEPEVLSYAVLYGTKYFYGTLTVIPAANIYYEESFLTYENALGATEEIGTWADLGSADLSAYQAADRPGFNNLASLDANNVYGYDGAYITSTTLSNGGAKIITVNETVGSAANAPYASFTFTGTGFDILSMTDNVAGTILVTVTDQDGKTVATKSVNNYFGYTYTEEDGWLADPTSSDTIWQVPVIKISGLEKATYTVKIMVIYLTSLEEDLYPNGTCTFVMDSVRIYDSAKGNNEADAAHKADNEYAPHYMTMKDLVLGTADLIEQEILPGVIFIDGKDYTSSVTDYDHPGPNNELYLAIGQGISFKLTASAIPTSTQIGVKMAYGTDAVIKHGIHDFLHVRGAGNMYYPMNYVTWNPVTDENGEVLYYETPVITLSHSNRDYFHDTSAVLSFTGFKFTFEEDDQMVKPVVDSATMEEALAVMTQLYAYGGGDLPEEDEGNPSPDNDKPQDEQETQPAPEENPNPPQEEETDRHEPEGDGHIETEEKESDEKVTIPERDPDGSNESSEQSGNTSDKDTAKADKGCNALITPGFFGMLLLLAACALLGRKRG